MNILAWYDVYLAEGFEIIPLKENTKIPTIKNWNNLGWKKKYVRDMFCKNPYNNIGFVCGSIMDVEGDSPKANDYLMKITKHCPHPMYSSSRSIHHLFISPDPSISILKYNQIEFRGMNHQSVLPPSKHKNGIRYEWLPESRFPIPVMPHSVLELLKAAKRYNENNKPGSKSVYCFKCKSKKSLHFKRLELEIKAFKILDKKWECNKCRSVDVRPICKEIKKRSCKI